MSNNLIQLRQINREEIEYLIRNLNDFDKDKAIKQGLRDSGKVFETGGKSRLKSRLKSGSKGVTGNLLKSFKTRVKRNKLGALIGFTKKGSHAHLIDKGTNNRYWKTKKRKYVGKNTPNLFWTDTKELDYPKAMNKVYDGIEKAINKISSRR